MAEKDTMKQGIIVESNAEYHGYQGAISKSRLSKMAVCPAYFKWCEENSQEPSDDLVFGQALHKFVLENADFEKEFVVAPNIDKRTKAGKEEWENFLTTVGDRQVISQDQFDTIQAMSEAINANKYAVALLQGTHEQSMYAVDELTGENIKTRPDCYRQVGDRLVITDLKSCRSALTDDFMRDVVKYAYDLQAYMYCMNASKVLGIPIENIDFVFICVQKSEPHLINILQADQYVLERGEALFREYIGTLKECKETGEWWGLNGKYGMINNLSLPSYLLKEVMKGE